MSDFDKYVKKLESLDCKNMYMNDFFPHLGKRPTTRSPLCSPLPTLSGSSGSRTSPAKYLTAAWEYPFSVTTPQEHVFPTPRPAIFSALRCRNLDEGKSQIAHGETLRETANMVSFMADTVGIRDDMYIGKGNKYMHDFADAVKEGYETGVLEQRPPLSTFSATSTTPPR